MQYQIVTSLCASAKISTYEKSVKEQYSYDLPMALLFIVMANHVSGAG